MQILLASPRGFCAGVRMAIQSLDRALEIFGAPVYVYHEIVHNRHVVDGFKKRGVVFVRQLEEVPPKSTLLYSAHGVSPDVRETAKARQLKTVDATCPLVTKVHREAMRFARENYTIILIGHAGHDEVVGTMGEAASSIRLVEKEEDIKALDIPVDSKVAYLTQTTLSMDDASAIIQALKKSFPGIAGPKQGDICYATQNRQAAVKQLAQQSELVLVIGSQNSSNSQRLAEIAKGVGCPAYLIDSFSEIQSSWLEGVKTVLITAGASAPEEVVQNCIHQLKEHHGATLVERTICEENIHFALPKELGAL